MENLPIEVSQSTSLGEMFFSSAKLYGKNNFLGIVENDKIIWDSYDELMTRVKLIGAGLKMCCFNNNPIVGLVEANSKYWVISAFATYAIGGTFIPMYPNELPINIGHILNDAGINILIVADDNIRKQIRKYLTDDITVITIRSADYKNSFPFIEELGKQNPFDFPKVDENQIAEIIYTSGTTGSSKGVQLTHKNLISNVFASHKYWNNLVESDCSLSILPWAHSFGQTCELHFMMINGGSIVLNSNKETLLQELKIVKPTHLLGVPKIFNKIMNFIISEVKYRPAIVRGVFNMGLFSFNRSELAKTLWTRIINKLIHKVINIFLYKTIRKAFGGRVKAFMCGSANLSIEVEQFFRALDMPLYNGYGLTECSPVVSVNSPKNVRRGSVGLPLIGTEIQIRKFDGYPDSDSGEVCVKSDSLMIGYLNLKEQTEKCFTSEGFFKTGDIGRIDNDGYLYIIGRIKDGYKLSNGKYCVPNLIEEAICMLPYIEHAFVYGENRAFNICLVTLDLKVLCKYAEAFDLKQNTITILGSMWLKDFIVTEIQKHLEPLFNKYMLPVKVKILGESFSVKNGMLTTTQKIRRAAILKKYESEIASLFEQ